MNSLTTRGRRMHAKVEIGSHYVGIPFDRPCLRRMPSGWHLHEPKRQSWLPTAIGMVLAVLFAAMVIRQVFP